ncbi:MAG: Lar family restriction alleviation protein [Alphaproteobacteria bacterium]|nr:Lar family restriction alleviation protein [Alphaproteobacteria bacterium]MBO6629044.1 Lar family restriction alleviation protein [Alphaproteobacteria bacterium]
MTDLKPCPFCGGEALILPDEDGFHLMHCGNPDDGSSHVISIVGGTKEEVAAQWNRRPFPTTKE